LSENFGNPDFWLALAASLLAAGFFIRWLYTGGRRRNK
jgi:hypothetical protein